MKKLTAILSALALLTVTTAFPASAETAVPVDVDEAVYAILLDAYGCDADKDGIVTEEEFCSVKSLQMNPSGFDDLSWMAGMDALTSITFEDGTLTDAAAQSLLQVPQIDTVQMYNVTLNSIGFLGEMQLDYCRMQGCTPFSDSELFSIMRVEDVTVQKGFSASGGVYPEGLFSTSDILLTIEDPSITCLDTYGTVESASSNSIFYGKEVGETTFTLSIYGSEEFTGTVTVEDFTPESIPLGEAAEAPEIVDAIYHGGGIGTALLKEGTLYSLNDGALQFEADNVQSVHYGYVYDETGKTHTCDIVVYQDGTVTANGTPVQTDQEFVYGELGCCVTADGDLYAIRRENGEYTADFVYSGFGSFDPKVGMCFFSDTGEVILMEYLYLENGGVSRQAFATGITNVISAQANYFADENHILWEVRRNDGEAPEIVKLAEHVEFVGIRKYEEYAVSGCVYITEDGRAYLPGSGKEVTLTEETEETETLHYLDAGNFPIYGLLSGGAFAAGGTAIGHDYHLTLDNVLTMEYDGVRTGITDVECFVDSDYSENGDVLYAYFLRTDGSLWCYSSETNAYSKITFTAPEPLAGDVNLDGSLTAADAVTLQSYLLGRSVLTAAQAENAELCGDGSVDGFDLAVLKRMLLS